MAKKRTIKKRVHRHRGWVVALFVLAFVGRIGSAIFLRAYQASLSVQIQKTQRQIVALSNEQEALSVDIQRLGNYNRIVSIAHQEGYESVNQNVITIATKNP